MRVRELPEITTVIKIHSKSMISLITLKSREKKVSLTSRLYINQITSDMRVIVTSIATAM